MWDFSRELKWVGLILALLAASSSQARVWNVFPDGSGDAATIQAAIDSCSAGDVVELACGTYTSVDGVGQDIWLNGERPVCFALKSGVTVRSETGDPECVTVDAQGQGGVAFSSGCDDVVIEGLTLTHGFATTVDGGNGGGVYCTYSNLVLRNCVIAGNSTPRNGGGVFGYHTTMDILGCRIDDNESVEAGGGGFFSDVVLRVEDSNIEGNRAPFELSAFGGGGFCLLNVRPLNIERCRFASNSIEQGQGGGLFVHGSDGSISSTMFEGNSAQWGGGMQLWDMDLTLSDCTIRDNSATELGGGLSAWNQSGYPHFINTDFHGNSAPDGPEGFLGSSAFVYLECCSFDPEMWSLHGNWRIDDEGCAVATEQSTWGEVKARYR